MRLLIILFALGSSTAQATPTRSFTLIWNEHAHGTKGEVTATTTFVVSDLKLHFESTYAGPNPDKPSHRPQKLDVDIMNDAVIDRALVALDKIAVTPRKPAADAATDDHTACLTRGKTTRCESRRGDAKSTPGFRAFDDLTEALMENVTLPR